MRWLRSQARCALQCTPAIPRVAHLVLHSPARHNTVAFIIIEYLSVFEVQDLVTMAEQAYTLVRGEFETQTTLEDIRQRAELFAIERKWIDYHTPRNLALAMVGEVSIITCSMRCLLRLNSIQNPQVGELAELFQWKSDEQCPVGLAQWSPKHFVKLSEEISDVMLYLIRLANQCHVNLPAALDRKIRLNNLKYPMEKAMGNAAKYTEYNTAAGNTEKSGGVVDVDKLESQQESSQAAASEPKASASELVVRSRVQLIAGQVSIFLLGVSVGVLIVAMKPFTSKRT